MPVGRGGPITRLTLARYILAGLAFDVDLIVLGPRWPVEPLAIVLGTGRCVVALAAPGGPRRSAKVWRRAMKVLATTRQRRRPSAGNGAAL